MKHKYSRTPLFFGSNRVKFCRFSKQKKYQKVAAKKERKDAQNKQPRASEAPGIGSPRVGTRRPGPDAAEGGHKRC